MTSPLSHAAEIAAWLAGTDITTLELIGPDGQLRLQRNGAGGAFVAVDPAEPPPQAAAASGPGEKVLSVHVGNLLRAHPLHDVPLVLSGQTVATGQAIALVQVGPLLLPVVAPRDGTIADVLATDGQLVGYGDAIAMLNPV